jgi:hypothetical protein
MNPIMNPKLLCENLSQHVKTHYSYIANYDASRYVKKNQFSSLHSKLYSALNALLEIFSPHATTDKKTIVVPPKRRENFLQTFFSLRSVTKSNKNQDYMNLIYLISGIIMSRVFSFLDV